MAAWHRERHAGVSDLRWKAPFSLGLAPAQFHQVKGVVFITVGYQLIFTSNGCLHTGQVTWLTPVFLFKRSTVLQLGQAR